jgi:hypothetical protein
MVAPVSVAHDDRDVPPGVLVRLHDSDLHDLGVATVPPPLEPGDLIATERGVWRAVDVVPLPAGSPLDAIAQVEPDTSSEQ